MNHLISSTTFPYSDRAAQCLLEYIQEIHPCLGHWKQTRPSAVVEQFLRRTSTFYIVKENTFVVTTFTIYR